MYAALAAKLRRKYGRLWIIDLQIALRRQGLRVTQEQITKTFTGKHTPKKWAAPAVILIANQLCNQP